MTVGRVKNRGGSSICSCDMGFVGKLLALLFPHLQGEGGEGLSPACSAFTLVRRALGSSERERSRHAKCCYYFFNNRRTSWELQIYELSFQFQPD